jgi:hypothetical protein
VHTPSEFDDLSKVKKLLFGGGYERVKARETREGWVVLVVETEVNRDSKSTNERGSSFLVRWVVVPVQETFFLTVPLSPPPQQARQAAVPGRLSLTMCLWLKAHLWPYHQDGSWIGTSTKMTAPLDMKGVVKNGGSRIMWVHLQVWLTISFLFMKVKQK